MHHSQAKAHELKFIALEFRTHIIHVQTVLKKVFDHGEIILPNDWRVNFEYTAAYIYTSRCTYFFELLLKMLENNFKSLYVIILVA